ncbi:hypothetical protein PPACK8108_LOCUS25697, partial [Phakopsora pachyrhizi]
PLVPPFGNFPQWSRLTSILLPFAAFALTQAYHTALSFESLVLFRSRSPALAPPEPLTAPSPSPILFWWIRLQRWQ